MAIDTPTEARCGERVFRLVVSRHHALLAASHNLALKQNRLQAFYLLWNQSRRGGWDLQNTRAKIRSCKIGTLLTSVISGNMRYSMLLQGRTSGLASIGI